MFSERFQNEEKKLGFIHHYQKRINFTEAVIAQGFDQILSAFLVKRGKMK